jgi:hypothetical protein
MKPDELRYKLRDLPPGVSVKANFHHGVLHDILLEVILGCENYSSALVQSERAASLWPFSSFYIRTKNKGKCDLVVQYKVKSANIDQFLEQFNQFTTSQVRLAVL